MLSTPLHPVLVHFPIALLIIGVIVQIIAIWRKPFFDQLALFLFSSGFLTGILAYVSGDGAEHFLRDQVGHSIESSVHIHETYALVTLFIFGAVVLLKLLHRFGFTKPLLPLVLVLSLAGAVTLSLTGHYGGKMVYHPESISPETPQGNK
ncbi:DUF2231 domain-containing protein [Fictibacillus fluitans]|uniref:DUF2231 domain-containing protein n=1 Tax=Fictibacillus fluitans TaxID=3058422 RepID=A0ABT8HVB1_9BACL|nr:DUF2231 domain-containing protein [Fictibacillus sp. NE201]MDN4524674.1 DUF2231 domain-containing protein [Fictibacillus sp. NE201]